MKQIQLFHENFDVIFKHSVRQPSLIEQQIHLVVAHFIVRHIFQHYWKRTVLLFFIIRPFFAFLCRFLSVQFFVCSFFPLVQQDLWATTTTTNTHIHKNERQKNEVWLKLFEIHSGIKIISLYEMKILGTANACVSSQLNRMNIPAKIRSRIIWISFFAFRIRQNNWRS